jgi:hypothetical protein
MRHSFHATTAPECRALNRRMNGRDLLAGCPCRLFVQKRV